MAYPGGPAASAKGLGAGRLSPGGRGSKTPFGGRAQHAFVRGVQVENPPFGGCWTGPGKGLGSKPALALVRSGGGWGFRVGNGSSRRHAAAGASVATGCSRSATGRLPLHPRPPGVSGHHRRHVPGGLVRCDEAQSERGALTLEYPLSRVLLQTR